MAFLRSDNEVVTTEQILLVLSLHGGFLFFSTLIEFYVFMKIKGELKSHGSNAVHCSSYIIVKWMQGQLASLASFLQICFIASIAACHWNDDAESIQQEAIDVA